MEVCPDPGNMQGARGVWSVTMDLHASKSLVGFYQLQLPRHSTVF